jgi:hypothetical protein
MPREATFPLGDAAKEAKRKIKAFVEDGTAEWAEETAKIAGWGCQNLVKVPTAADLAKNMKEIAEKCNMV